ncbi:hypothetical protein LRS13_07155 [Svornostia abyssi]|uniref:Uncharacterized protein n=1 Tax=Svornostia abyssi TaxID=2898438 RepID=A0ABY5PKY9_9ACTN|nr:hypothetical protein LRS13_07155 [Parviterribacteraceae bacterium J379]
MTLREKLVAIHRALDAAALPHAFGGAIALAYATLDPRGTSDIDVNVFSDAADAAHVLDALPREISSPPGVVDALVRDGQARLWWDETPVDLFLDTVPLHADAAAHRREVPFAGTTIPVLGPVELAVFKATFDRTKDWADIEAMLAARTLDPEEVRIALSDLLPHGDQRFARLAAAAREAERSHE